MMKKIILTGGGTAGHVIPNLALVPSLKEAGFEVHYIGSRNGIERELVEAAGIPYYAISSGKLRRYFSVKNAADIFRVSKGLIDAVRVIRKIKPDIVFSKGGFVVVPVVAAARLCRIKSVIHESDITPGLANKLAIPFATKVCVSFPETLAHIPKSKGILTGSPIRQQLFEGKPLRKIRPTLLVTGGSLGAAAINACVRDALPTLLQKFDVVHLCGKGNLSGIQQNGYTEHEYLADEMADIFATADIVVSRAGANTLFELTALCKPNLLIPLPLGVSRGDQIQNAASFQKRGISMVLPEDEMTPARLAQDVNNLYNNRHQFVTKMKQQEAANGVKNVLEVITSSL